MIDFGGIVGTVTVPCGDQMSWTANSNALRCRLSPHFLMA
ncbi:hypothetical protein ENTCAN_06418 [Enterobacter cancerogenus ATCC 35316]|nr:hypothetical protein ENTCAN_06418 [Enterobacter cancerogenus ATCC 35316]